jgi:hypothetical protein
MRTLGVDAPALQQAITKCVIVPFLASIDDEDQRKALTKTLEKNAENSIELWIAMARRRIS